MSRIERALRTLLNDDMSLDPKEVDPGLDGYCALEGPKQHEKHHLAWEEARAAVAALDQLRKKPPEGPFVDFLLHENIDFQVRRFGEHVVMLRREGSNYVEAKGRVILYYCPDMSPDDFVNDLKTRGGIVFTYNAELDKAQGYAQGIYDGLQVAAGVAGRTPTHG